MTVADTYRVGVAIVVGGIFVILVVVALIELWCELLNIPSLSARIDAWTQKRRWFALGLIVGWAMLLAHFFLNALSTS